MDSSTTALDGGAIGAVAKLAQDAASVDVTEIGGRVFTDKAVHRVALDPDLPKPLNFYTLAAFAAWLKNEQAAKDAMVHVVSATRVEAIGPLEGTDKHLRRAFAVAECPIGNPLGFKFNEAVPMEALAIALQTCFAPGLGTIEELRKFCASVRTTNEIRTADDGVSQEVNAKAGIAAVVPVTVNNPWELAPFRTFAEVEQPTSPYVLRFFRSSDGEPRAGLFETGNAQWKPDAVGRVATWLRGNLNGIWVVLG